MSTFAYLQVDKDLRVATPLSDLRSLASLGLPQDSHINIPSLSPPPSKTNQKGAPTAQALRLFSAASSAVSARAPARAPASPGSEVDSDLWVDRNEGPVGVGFGQDGASERTCEPVQFSEDMKFWIARFDLMYARVGYFAKQVEAMNGKTCQRVLLHLLL